MSGGADAADAPVLLADIGGTNARFALLSAAGVEARRNFAVAHYPTPESAVQAYFQDVGGAVRPERAVLAVAGPVTGPIGGGQARLTNADWRFDARALGAALGCPVWLVNDFEAQAWAAGASGPEGLRRIGGAEPVAGAPLAVIGPGTGLGMAGFLPDGASQGGEVAGRAIVGEGGHSTLAARNDPEAELLARLRAHYGHVSAERLVSGPGLVLLAATLGGDPGSVKHRSAEAVVAAARAGDEDARRALATFFDLLGAVAGNLALTLGARGGVFLTGGMLPRLEQELLASGFREAFEAKGRMRDYLAAIPCFLMKADDPAFIGLQAMARAWRRSDGSR